LPPNFSKTIFAPRARFVFTLADMNGLIMKLIDFFQSAAPEIFMVMPVPSS